MFNFMLIISGLLGFLCFCALAYVFISLYQSRQQSLLETQQKQAQQTRIRQNRERLKLALRQYSARELLNAQQTEALFRIANNFFVFQRINEETVGAFERMCSQFADKLEQLANAANTPSQREQLSAKLGKIARALPPANNQFSAQLYSGRVTPLLTDFYMFELEAAEPQDHKEAESTAKV